MSYLEIVERAQPPHLLRPVFALVRRLGIGRAFGEAVPKSGRLPGIVRAVLARPKHAGLGLYSAAVLHGPSGLSRAEREALATVVSATNRCRF